MPVTLLGETALMRRLAALRGPNIMGQTLKLVGISANREQKLLVHRKTGMTGRTIGYRMVGTNTVETYAGGAAVFSLGTRAHTITPNARKALRFAASPGGARLTGSPRVGAAVVFAKIVHHPGTRPWPFMLPGAVAGVQQAGIDPIVIAWNTGI